MENLSRRQALQSAFAGTAAVVTATSGSVLPANAIPSEETPRIVTRMGGLLVCLDFGKSLLSCHER